MPQGCCLAACCAAWVALLFWASVLGANSYTLIFGVALHDEGQFTPVGQTDGVTFAVQVEADGQTSELFRRHQSKVERRIEHTAVDLSPYAGKVIRLRFVVDPGPGGDATYDWGVWVDPRIVQGDPPPVWWNQDSFDKAHSVPVVFSAIDAAAKALVGVGEQAGQQGGAIFSPDAFPVGWDVSAMPWPMKVCYGERVRGIFAQPAWDGGAAASWGEYRVGLGVDVPESARVAPRAGGSERADIDGATAQLQEAAALADNLHELIERGKAQGLQMRMPRVTAAVLKIYLPRIHEDLQGIAQYIGPNFPGWYDKGPPYGFEHAAVSLADKGKSPGFIAERRERGAKMAAYLVQTAHRAIAEARETLAHPDDEVKYPEYDMSNLTIRDGYFHEGDEPALLTGLYTNYDITSDDYDGLAEMGICFTQPERLNVHCTLPEEGRISTEFIDAFVVRDTLQNARHANIGAILDLGLQYLPGWMAEKYPGLINPGSSYNTYGPYAVVSPEMRTLAAQYLDQLIPRTAAFPVALGYEMANQAYHNPWSPQVIEMFQTWARQRYATIERANDVWSCSFASFEQIQIPEDLRQIQSLGLRYDWIRFQHGLTSDWYTWLKGEIQSRAPDARVEVHLAGNYFEPQKFKLHDCLRTGIDEVDVFRDITDVTGIDYCTWYWSRFVYEQAGQHCDLLRSIAPDKPVVNFEYGLGTYNTSVSWPASYIRGSLWYSYLHGMAGCALWTWTVSELADESQQNTFARWPDRMETLGRTALELRRFAGEIAAFGRQKGEIALLYSAPSRWFDHQLPGEYYQQARQMWHAVSMIDAPFEFLCDEQVEQGELNRFKILLVPACDDVTDETFEHIRQFVQRGGTILMTAGSFSKDAYGKPRALDASWTNVTDPSSLLQNNRPQRDGKGWIYHVNPTDVGTYQRLIDLIADRARVRRPVRAAVGRDLNRSVEVRCVPAGGEGQYVLYCFNLDANPVDVRWRIADGFSVTGDDLLQGRPMAPRMTLQPLEIRLWRVTGPGTGN